MKGAAERRAYAAGLGAFNSVDLLVRWFWQEVLRWLMLIACVGMVGHYVFPILDIRSWP